MGDGVVANTGQSGIMNRGTYGHMISNVYFENFMGNALYLTSSYVKNNTYNCVGCHFQGNNVGFFADTYGEYASFGNCTFIENQVALNIKGGNNNFTNCIIDLNVDGVRLLAGSNDGHGKFVGCDINHNTGYGLFMDTVANGETFVDCHIYYSKIYLKDCVYPITFQNCTLDPVTFWGEGCARILIEGCFFPCNGITQLGINMAYNSKQSSVVSRNNSWQNKAFNTLTNNLEGGLVVFKSTAVLNLTAGALNTFKPTLNFACTAFNNPDTINGFYDPATGYIKKSNLNSKTAKIRISIKITKLAGDTTVGWAVAVMSSTATVIQYIPITQYLSTLMLAAGNFELLLEPLAQFYFAIVVPTGVTATIPAGGEFALEIQNL